MTSPTLDRPDQTTTDLPSPKKSKSAKLNGKARFESASPSRVTLSSNILPRFKVGKETKKKLFSGEDAA